MKVLVIGSGGREHALVWALKKSPRVSEIVCAPGNGGVARMARCVPAKVSDLTDLLRVIAAERPDLTIVGPELPLSLGLVDEMRRRGLAVFGPTQGAAKLETSKGFAKRFMQRHKIPTANYAICTGQKEALESLGLFHLPVVIKADGLAAGKGVLICEAKAEAEQAIAGLFSGKLLGTAEKSVVLEEFLTGEELSFLVLSDGKHVAPLVPSQDHKRLGEGDTGPNTGGMGVYSTDAMLDDKMRDWLLHHVAQPTIDGMAAEDTPFSGVLYCGLMMTAKGPMVLEYNARFGDPETQAILARLDSDLLEALEACAEGRLSEAEFRWKPGASACVVAASGGYPGSYTNGHKITGLEDAAKVPGVVVFHAGTALVGDDVRTNGGRVLGVTATGKDLQEALKRAYEGIGKIGFEGMYYRKDIGWRAVGNREMRKAVMRMTKRKPVSAGEILTEEFMGPLGMSQMEMAALTGLPRKQVNQLCRNRRAVTADTALILACVFGNSADFWLNTQRRTDLWEALHTPERRARIERAKTLKRRMAVPA